MNTINIENMILTSFLYADDMGMDTSEAFELDSKLFTSSYRRATAEKINDCTRGDKAYSVLSYELEDHTAGTKYEQEWIDIIAQTPMPFIVVKRFYDKLKVEYKRRIGKEWS